MGRFRDLKVTYFDGAKSTMENLDGCLCNMEFWIPGVAIDDGNR